MTPPQIKPAPVKVALSVGRVHRNPFYAKETRPLTMALPFFRSSRGWLWHRVRGGDLHYVKGAYSHTSIHYWCGNCGYMGSKKSRGGELSADPGAEGVHCALCEGNAAGMGLEGSNKILGRTVCYTPRGGR